MGEEYRQAIENAFALINIPGFSLVELIDVLLAADLPLAVAIALSLRSYTGLVPEPHVGAAFLRATSRVSESYTREVAPRAAALYLWLTRVAVDQGISVDSGLQAWRDHALQDEIRAAMQASVAKFPHWVRHTSAGAFDEPAVDTPVGWVAHVKVLADDLIMYNAPSDVETAVVGYAARGKIDPEIALAICLQARICARLQSHDSSLRAGLTTQAPSIAAALAEALEHWRRSMALALVLPAVII